MNALKNKRKSFCYEACTVCAWRRCRQMECGRRAGVPPTEKKLNLAVCCRLYGEVSCSVECFSFWGEVSVKHRRDSPAPLWASRLMNSTVPSCAVLLASRYSTCWPPGQYLKAWQYPTRFTWRGQHKIKFNHEQSHWQMCPFLLVLHISHLWLLSWFDVDVFCTNISMNILVWVDVLQHI